MQSSSSAPPVAVVTVTRRPNVLRRCLASVNAQDYQGTLRHVILSDACPNVARTIEESGGRVSVEYDDVPRDNDDSDGPGRLGYLRNAAVAKAGSDHVVFLDDDNEWEGDHVSSLVDCINGGWDIAHSQRQLFLHDGEPYLIEEFPWGRDERTRRAVYAYCLEAGIMSRGSHIMRDRLEMRFSWVDLGEWIFPPGFLLDHPFQTTFGAWEWFHIDVEDRALPRAVFDSGLSVTCTEKPTLRYYLGGYTNNYGERDIRWQPPGVDPTGWKTR